MKSQGRLRDHKTELSAHIYPFKDVINVEYYISNTVVRIVVDHPEPMNMGIMP